MKISFVSCGLTLLVALVFALPALAEIPAADLQTFENEIKPLLNKYCLDCHGPDKSKADVRVDELNPDLYQGFDAEHWEEVYNQLNVGEMPPEDHPLRKKFGWFPTGEGADFEFTEAHRNFEPFRDKLTYFGGLSHPLGRRVPGHKAGDVYLTGADISGSAYRQSISVDPAGPGDYLRTMYDLIVLAFQTDSTRVATNQMASEEGNDVAATFPHAVGINKTSHAVSHARTDYQQWSTYNQFLTEQYAYFLGRLDAVEDVAGGTLLDSMMTMLGCCTSQTHVSRNYPLLFSGGSKLGFQHGHYRRYDENKVPLSNLSTTMLDRMGTGEESFKDSNAMMTELLRA